MKHEIFSREVSMYSNLFWDAERNSKPMTNVVKLSYVINRIRNGRVIEKINTIRAENDKEKRDELKKNLPVICFSGVFKNHRHSDNLVKHSGLIVLDFDKVDDVEKLKKELSQYPFIVCCFVSPSGNGLKAVVWIKETDKHNEHYLSLLKDFPTADKSNKDVARACFDSYDPEIYVNENPKPYTKILKSETYQFSEKIEVTSNTSDFEKIVKWLENKNESFVSGNRNNFIYLVAGACCRFGILQNEAEYLIDREYLSKDTTFTKTEFSRTVNSAYKKNSFGTAKFENDKLVTKTDSQEVVIDLDAEIQDVIYGKDVWEDALKLFRNGYESAESSGIVDLDTFYKFKRGEVTALTGIGNYGKSEFWNYVLINKSIYDGTKWAIFSPESYPTHEFYHGLTEMLIGANCTPKNYDGTPNQNYPLEQEYQTAYEWVSEHFFYIYPESLSPSPEYIKSRFLELIIKEKVDGVVIDPFNQLANDYGNRRDDQYLDVFLSDCSKFARNNNVFFSIIVHPKTLHKNAAGVYPEPDVFDISGGAMWNNKLDNILVYHRPNYGTDPNDNTCTLSTKKIKRQKIVGKKGVVEFQYNRSSRRFDFKVAPINNFISNELDLKENTFNLKMKDPLKHTYPDDWDKLF